MMNLEETKQALIALLETGKTGSFLPGMWTRAIEDIKQSETASELANVTLVNLPALYTEFGEKATAIVKESLSPTVWKAAGLYINPEIIESDSQIKLIVLCDGSVNTRQTADADVTYIGDVKLTIESGSAHVLDTKYPAYAYGDDTFVDAVGKTEVFAYDKSSLQLGGYARATLYNEVEAEALGHAFVESRGTRTRITAADYAAVLVSQGSVELTLYNGARGVVMTEDFPTNKRPLVNVHGSAVLYARDLDAIHVDRHVSPLSDFTTGLVMDGERMSIAPDRMRDILLSGYAKDILPLKCEIPESLPIDTLKREVKPYIFDSEMELFREAADEREVCSILSIGLSERLNRGLTGEFLRSHFTAETLAEHNIHSGFNEHLFFDKDTTAHRHVFLGDGVIDHRLYGSEVIASERTLLLTNVKGGGASVNQSANAFAWGHGEVNAFGCSLVIGMQDAKTYAKEDAKVELIGNSHCKASDSAHVVARDSAHVNGSGEATLVLLDHSEASVKGKCLTLALQKSTVTADGQAEVAFATYNPEDKPDIQVMSPNVSLRGLKTPKEVEVYERALRAGTSARRDASALRSRG